MSIRASEFESAHVAKPLVRQLLRIGARALDGAVARRRAARGRRACLRELRQLSPHLKADIGVAERRPREAGMSV